MNHRCKGCDGWWKSSAPVASMWANTSVEWYASGQHQMSDVKTILALPTWSKWRVGVGIKELLNDKLRKFRMDIYLYELYNRVPFPVSGDIVLIDHTPIRALTTENGWCIIRSKKINMSRVTLIFQSVFNMELDSIMIGKRMNKTFITFHTAALANFTIQMIFANYSWIK